MTPAEEFERELEIFRTEAESAIQFLYAYLAIHEAAGRCQIPPRCPLSPRLVHRKRARRWWWAAAIWLIVSAATIAGESPFPQPLLQVGETGQAWSMDFSADGTLIAVANDNRVTLFDREHRWLVRDLIGHNDRVEAVAFGSSGKILASGSANGEVATWDASTGKLLRLRKGGNSTIAGLKFTARGGIVTAGWDKTLRIWDDGKCVESCILAHTTVSPESLAISPDEHWMAVGDTASAVTVWRLDLEHRRAGPYQTLTLPDSTPDNPGFVRGVAFDEHSRLAAVSFSGAIVVQDVPGWTTVLTQHSGLRLDGVAFGPHGSIVYAAGMQGGPIARIVAYATTDGTRIQLPETPAYWPSVGGNAYRSLALSHDGKWLLAGGTYLLEWNLTKPDSPELFGSFVQIPVGAILSPYADSVMVPLQTIHFFSLRHSHFMTLPNQSLTNMTVVFPLGSTAMTADERFMATPGLSHAYTQLFVERCSKLPQSQMGQCAQSLMSEKDPPPMYSLQVFRGSDLTYLNEFETDLTVEASPAFSPDGEKLIWRATNGLATVDTACMCNKQIFEVALPHSGSFDLAVDGSVKFVATPKDGTNGNAVQLYSFDSHSIANTLQLDDGDHVRQLRFNSATNDQLRTLAVGTTSGSVYLWHPSTNDRKKIAGGSPVASLAFSVDGTSLAIGRDDGTLEVLPLNSQKPIALPHAHAGAITDLRFGGGGRWIASVSRDAVEFWNASDLHRMGTLIFPLQPSLSWLFVTPDGLFDGDSRALDRMLWRLGPNLMDVGPVELFTADYFRQGLIESVLFGAPAPDPPPKLSSKNLLLPKLTVHVDVKDPSKPSPDSPVTVHIHINRAAPGKAGEVKDLRLLRKGILVKHWHGLIPASTTDLQERVAITPGENNFTAYAFNSDNVKSLDATDGVLGDRSLAKQGVVYILAIGVDNYSNGIPPLHYSGNDVRAFSAAVKAMQNDRSVHVATLLDGEATRDNILCALRRLRTEGSDSVPACIPAQLSELHAANIEDAVYIFYSGHGVSEQSRFSLLPQTAAYTESSAPNGPKVLTGSISDQDLEHELEPVLASQVVLVLDACGSGGLVTAAQSSAAPINLNGFAQMAREKGIYVLAAATARQAAMESPGRDPANALSYLTYVLVDQGLEHKQASSGRPDGTITIEDWFNYAVRKVPSEADQQPVAFMPRSEEAPQQIVGRFAQ